VTRVVRRDRRASPLASSVIAAERPASPRWYAHPYNRAGLYRLAAALGWLPRHARLCLARRAGRLALRLMPEEHAVVRRTLTRVLGPAEARRLDALTVRTFTDFAMCFSDLVSTNRRPAARLAGSVGSVEGADRVPSGLGLISLTAHVGNWELAGRLLAGRTARTTHVVVAEEEALQLEQWVRRNGDGVRFVTRSRPTISLELVAALRRGDVVAVQGDRALGTRGDVLVPFFGRPAPFPLGPFILARAVGMPLVPAFCLLDSDYRYRVKVAEPLVVRRGGEEDAARAWVGVLERVVREYPTQWFNFFDVWNPWPAGAGFMPAAERGGMETGDGPWG
jgi:Kdo2-lipid IVA lauroyltransferase/acyltransferase